MEFLEGKFQVKSLRILYRKEIAHHNRVIAQVKVQWKHFSPDEATWELEEEILKTYPTLFQEIVWTLRIVLYLRGGGCDILKYSKQFILKLLF